MQVQLLIKGSRCPFSFPPNSFPFPWLTQWRMRIYKQTRFPYVCVCVPVELWDRIMNINRNFHVLSFLPTPALPFNFPSLFLMWHHAQVSEDAFTVDRFWQWSDRLINDHGVRIGWWNTQVFIYSYCYSHWG